jgi:dTMP kinase
LAAIIVCFEGIDGSGKTTQLRRVAERLESGGHSAVRLRAISRRSPFFAFLEAMMDDINRTTFCNIVAFNRYIEIEQLIAQHRDDFDILFFDRYLMTDFSYTKAFGCSTEFVEELLSRVTKPDLVVLSEVTVDLAMDRIGRRESILEFQENREVLSGAARQYHEHRVDGWRTLVVDGSQDMDGVTDLIHGRIVDLLVEPVSSVRSVPSSRRRDGYCQA